MATPLSLTDDEKRKLRTGILPTQESSRVAPKASVGPVPELPLPDAPQNPLARGLSAGVFAKRRYEANTNPRPVVPTEQNLGGAGGFAGPRMSQDEVDAQQKETFQKDSRGGVTFAAPQPGGYTSRNAQGEIVQGVSVAAPAPPPAAPQAPAPDLTARVEQASGLPAAAPQQPLETRMARLGSEMTNAQVNSGTFRKPQSDVNDYSELGTGPMGSYVRMLLQNQDRVRSTKNKQELAKEQAVTDRQAQSDIFKERMASERNLATLEREDLRQAETGKREQARLDLDREKLLNEETRNMFTTEVNGEKSFDQAGFTEMRDYMTATGESDPYKAKAAMDTEAKAAAAAYQTPENLAKAITAEKDPGKKRKLERVYQIAYGALPVAKA